MLRRRLAELLDRLKVGDGGARRGDTLRKRIRQRVGIAWVGTCGPHEDASGSSRKTREIHCTTLQAQHFLSLTPRDTARRIVCHALCEVKLNILWRLRASGAGNCTSSL